MLIPRHHRRLLALLPPVAIITFVGFLGAPGTEAPAAAPLQADAVALSASGKIVDRLPSQAPAAPHFAARLAQADWPMTAASETGAAVAFASEPVLVAVASPISPAAKPARPAAQMRRADSVVAVLPPPRPASLGVPQAVASVVAIPERHLSIAARMVAFVGSLASLARL